MTRFSGSSPELAQSGGTGRAGVKQSDFDASCRQASEDFHDGAGPAGPDFGNEHCLEVGGHDVDAGPRRQNAFAHDAVKMIAIDNQFAMPGGRGRRGGREY